MNLPYYAKIGNKVQVLRSKKWEIITIENYKMLQALSELYTKYPDRLKRYIG